MPTCNTTLEDAIIVEEPIIGQYITFHHLGLFLAAIFGLVSVGISLYLILRHATNYTRPQEQRHIIRILFMIPIYAVVSFLSFYYYRHAIYFEALRDCYEAFAISSFFALLCAYVRPELHDQKEYFRAVRPVNWFWKVFGLQMCTGGAEKGILRRPRSGLTWFNIIWVGIFQYCFIRVVFTIVSVATQPFGLYCAESYSPAFAHIWAVTFECLSVTVAMFMVVQFYIQLKSDLAEHQPGIKVLAIKLVIFFSFWQTMLISFLASADGPLQPTPQLSYQDIKIGIPSVILIIEMALFSILHVFAYPWKPYSPKHSPAETVINPGYPETPHKGGPMGIKALADAFNPWDIVKASARGFRWMFVGVRQRHMDVSYQSAAAAAGKFGTGQSQTGYMSSTAYAMAGGGNSTSKNGRRGRSGTTAEDDRAGLLHDIQAPAGMGGGGGGGSSPPYYRSPLSNDGFERGEDGNIDLGVPRRQQQRHPTALHTGGGRGGGGRQNNSPWAATTDWKPSEFQKGGGSHDFDAEDREEEEDEERDFHPGMGPPPGAEIVVGKKGDVHPLHRGQAPHVPPGQGWNHWGGVESSTSPTSPQQLQQHRIREGF